jgi:hypothetical protein
MHMKFDGETSRLEEISSRFEKTTPPPWEVRKEKDDKGIEHIYVWAPCPCCGFVAETELLCGESDANFIAAARLDVPWLVDRVKILRRQLEEEQDRSDLIEKYIKEHMGDRGSPAANENAATIFSLTAELDGVRNRLETEAQHVKDYKEALSSIAEIANLD